MDIQKALKAVGDSNSYQIFTIIFICFKWLIVAYLVFLPSYMFINPTFNCGSLTKVSEEDASKLGSLCVIDNPHTLTAQSKLYFDKRYIRDSILSSEFIGSIVGLVVMSILADRLGRKLIIVATLFLSTIGAVVFGFGGLYDILPLLYVGVILMGFGGYALSIVSFSYLSQVNSDRWRQTSIILTYSFWALAEILLYPAITFEPDWKVLMGMLILFPLVILLIMSYFLVETPAFLYNKSKAQCIESLNQIADWNDKPHLTINQLQDRSEDKQIHYEIHETITKSQFLVPLIILSLAQICNNGMYYITQFSIYNIGSSFQMNMLIIGVLELIAYIITNLYCHRMRRKLFLIIFLCVSGAIGILYNLAFRKYDNNTTWDAQRILETLFIAVSRLANTFGFALFGLITTESFPTSIKTTGTGIVQALSNVGNLIAPFIVTFADKFHIQSMFIGGALVLLGALSMFFSKETLVKKPSNQQEQPLLRESTMQANLENLQIKVLE